MKHKKISLSNLLFEQGEDQTIPTDVPPQSTQQPQNYSLDQKVDHFLIQYERESNPSAARFPDDAGLGQALTTQSGTQSVGAGFSGGQSAVATPVAMEKGVKENVNKKHKNFLKTILWEQDDMGGDAPPPDAGADMGGGAPDLGGDPMAGAPDAGADGSSPDAEVAKPQINLSAFTNKVARLISNFDSLVNPKVIVLNRAYAYIRQNYDENTAKEMMIILESTYNISNMTLGDKERNLVGQVPFAVGAGDGGGGGGGA